MSCVRTGRLLVDRKECDKRRYCLCFGCALIGYAVTSCMETLKHKGDAQALPQEGNLCYIWLPGKCQRLLHGSELLEHRVRGFPPGEGVHVPGPEATSCETACLAPPGRPRDHPSLYSRRLPTFSGSPRQPPCLRGRRAGDGRSAGHAAAGPTAVRALAEWRHSRLEPPCQCRCWLIRCLTTRRLLDRTHSTLRNRRRREK